MIGLLTRHQFEWDGILGTFQWNHSKFYTLEHAYASSGADCFQAKIPVGTYLCVRGTHHLEGQLHPFETFEVTQVPGHSNLLFHPGNSNKDSSGCILLGNGVIRVDHRKALSYSRVAFQTFMTVLEGIHHFTLRIEETSIDLRNDF